MWTVRILQLMCSFFLFVPLATNELLQLLSEITPSAKKGEINLGKEILRQDIEKPRVAKSVASNTRPNEAVAVKKDIHRKPELVKINKAIVTKGALFGQVNSQILSNQFFWLSNDPVPLLILPFIEPSTMVLVSSDEGKIKLMKKNVKNYHVLPPLISLDCVISDMNYDVCIVAQKRCMSYLSKLRSSIATLSETKAISTELDGLSFAAPFLHIESAKIVKVSPAPIIFCILF